MNTKNEKKNSSEKQSVSLPRELLASISERVSFLEADLSHDLVVTAVGFCDDAQLLPFSELVANECGKNVHPEDVCAFLAFFDIERLFEMYASDMFEDSLEYRSPGGRKEMWYKACVNVSLDPATDSLMLNALFIGLDSDHGEKKRLEELAYVDSLTGLLNREGTESSIRRALEECGDEDESALFMVDLDNLKQINDTKGHQAGDKILHDFAKAVSDMFRNIDTIGRMGGDEFMIFIARKASRQLVESRAAAMVEALQFSYDNILVTASIGVTMCRGGSIGFDELYAKADQALYAAKAKGKNCYCVSETDSECLTVLMSDDSQTVPLTMLLEHMDGGVVLADVGEDISFKYVSPSFYKSMQRSEEETGKDGSRIMSLVCSEDIPLVRESVFKAAGSDEVVDCIYRVGEMGALWRHIRLARLPGGDKEGRISVIGVITDVTELKNSQMKLQLAEERYRLATGLSRSMIWEVDIPSRTFYQSADASRALGYNESVYYNAPEGLLEAGVIHPDSADDFCKMFDDLYAGIEGKEYTILSQNEDDEYTWRRISYRILRGKNEKPLRAVGIVETMPNINAEMSAFQDELRFMKTVSPLILGTTRVNLSCDSIEEFTLPLPAGVSSYSRLYELCESTVIDSGDLTRFAEITDRSRLIAAYKNGQTWRQLEYGRRMDDDWSVRQTWVAVKLLRHPVSGDIFAFGYYCDIDAAQTLARNLTGKLEYDDATMLYSRDTFARIVCDNIRSMPSDILASVTVFTLCGYDRIKAEAGIKKAQRIIAAMGLLFRILVTGYAASGSIGEKLIAVYRSGARSKEQQRIYVQQIWTRVRELLSQIFPDIDILLSCGFSIAEKNNADYEKMLRQATISCTTASTWQNDQILEYSDPESIITRENSGQAPSAGKQSILIAEDDYISRKLLVNILKNDYRIDEAENGSRALELIRENDYDLVISDIQMPEKTGWDVLSEMSAEGRLSDVPVLVLTSDANTESEIKALAMGASDVIVKPFVARTLVSRIHNIIGRRESARISEQNRIYELRFQQQANLLRMAEHDELTGIYNRQAFYRYVRERLDANPGKKYMIVRWDVDNFKILNDALGVGEGDRLLRDIGTALRRLSGKDSIYARMEADHFVDFISIDCKTPEEVFNMVRGWFASYKIDFKLTLRMGVYIVDDPSVDVRIMCDRAMLALKSIKGSFTKYIAYYDDSLRAKLLEEQQLADEMTSALAAGQFVMYFQPQYNYSSGEMTGAEALARWEHPERGMIMPGVFVPLFERNGFISALDEYVWEEACRHIRRWMDDDESFTPVPVSVNISRLDIYNPHLCGKIKELIKKYDLPASYLRLEITESAYMENAEQLICVTNELRQAGFIVEMDDFGSGYSSLNTLKDVQVDILKLDVKFLSKGEDDVRGGSIISSVIRMAHWLKIPVIAEGVETKAQADYLKNLDCLYMQGYYFDRPMPAEDFEKLLAVCPKSSMNRYEHINTEGMSEFWDASAQTALLFNSFVGGAAIIEYQYGNVELLRANDGFFKAVCTTREEYTDNWTYVLGNFDEKNRKEYLRMLDEAITTGGEAECEIQSLPGKLRNFYLWTHNRARMLARNGESYLIYVSVENITERKRTEENLRISREELQFAIANMGKSICHYDAVEHTLTLPEKYAAYHEIPTVLTDVPDNSELFPEECRDELVSFFLKILRGEKSGDAELRFVMPGGIVVWERHGFSSFMSDNGKPCRAIIDVEDITAQKEREAMSKTLSNGCERTTEAQALTQT